MQDDFRLAATAFAIALMVLGACDGSDAPPATEEGVSTIGSAEAADAAGAPSVAAPTGAAAVYLEVHEAIPSAVRDGLRRDRVAAEALTPLAPQIGRLVEAAASPTCDFGSLGRAGPFGDRGFTRAVDTAVRLLRADAVRRAGAGDVDGAARRVVAMLQISAQLGADSRTREELGLAIALAGTGVGTLRSTPALGGGTDRAELLAALDAVEREVLGRCRSMIGLDATLGAAWLRSVDDVDYGAAKGLAPRSAPERAAAAEKLERLAAEAERAWDGSDADRDLRAVADRAKTEGVADLFRADPAPVRLRVMHESLRESIESARSGLSR